MSHYITNGSINIPTTIQSIRIVASGEGGNGANVSGSTCTNGTNGGTTSFLGVSAGGGQGGKCGSSITPPPYYISQTCYTPVVTVTPPPYYISQTCYTPVETVTPPPYYVQQTCYTPVETVTPPPYYVQQTCYTPVETVTPPPYYIQTTCTRTVYDTCVEYTTCYTPVETVTPPPYYVQQTCSRTVAQYHGACSVWAFWCATDRGQTGVNACTFYNGYCPEYVTEYYECGYDYQPPSYTTGGDPYQCGTGNTYDCNPRDEQYTCYQLYQPPSYTTGGDPYECGYNYQPPTVTTGGGGGSGGTATGGNIVNLNGNTGGAGTLSPLSGGAGGAGHLGGDGTAGNTSSSGSDYYFGGGGGEGAYIETIYNSAQLSANNWFGTQSFSVNGGSGLNNGYLDIYFEFPQMLVKTDSGWKPVRNIYIKTGASTWSNVTSAQVKQ